MYNEDRRLVKDYYNSHYKDFNTGLDPRRYRNEMVLEFGEFIKKDFKILDLGCGAGFFLKILENEGCRDIYGVEIDTPQFMEASKILKHTKILNKGVMEFLTETKEKFDVIFILDVLEHMAKEQIIPLLMLVNKSLNDKGVLILKTPNADSSILSSRMRYLDFTHELSFNENSIKMVLKEAGFEDIACRSTKTYFGSIFSPLVFLVRSVFEIAIRIYIRTYLREAFRMILTPNFVTIVKK